MAFSTEYYSTLDRGFYHKEQYQEPVPVDFPEPSEPISNLTLKNIGTTIDFNINPVQALGAKIREGAARLEMGFSGMGKGGFGGQQATPEILGKLERQEFKELAKLNEVKVTTHASVGIHGLSGFNPEAGRFDDRSIQNSIKEINKAIEFAATATHGGAVVFHTGEWERPIIQAGLTEKERKQGIQQGLFKEYETEPQKSRIFLADEETGQIIAIGKEEKFYFPEEKYNKDTGMWYLEKDSSGRPKVKELNYDQAIKHIKDLHKDDPEFQKKPESELALMAKYEQRIKTAEGESLRFSYELEEWKDQLKKTVEAKKFVEKLWDKTPEDERWRLLERIHYGDGIIGKYLTPDTKNPMELLDKQELKLKQQIQSYQSISASSQEQYESLKKTIDRIKPIEEVGIKKTADSIAKVGIKAMLETERNRKDLDEPVFVSPESYSPQYFGSHPDEIIMVIDESRKSMAEQLIRKGYSKQEAMEKAKTHIKATLDSGHFNMWRQHFQAREGESADQAEKRFEKWYIDQTKRLADAGVLGQIHLSDNFGYDDEHLTMGQGNIPFKEFMQNMEKAGLKDFIAERGSYNGPTILFDTMAAFGSPLYKLNRAPNFSNIRHGHLGYAAPANYIVGAYAPSNEWRLWSEVPLE